MAPTYRLYLLGAGGDIVGSSDLWGCADDASAIQAARGRTNGFAIELWRGARLVHRSPAAGGSAGPGALAMRVAPPPLSYGRRGSG